MVPTSGIATLVLGRYLLFGYLHPQGNIIADYGNHRDTEVLTAKCRGIGRLQGSRSQTPKRSPKTHPKSSGTVGSLMPVCGPISGAIPPVVKGSRRTKL